MFRRLAILAVVLCSVGALSVAPDATAGSVTGAPRMTWTQLKTFAVGKHVGPNRFTSYGTLTIKSFTYSYTKANGKRVYTVNTAVTGGCGSRCLAPVSPMTNAAGDVRAAALGGGYMLNGEWWNPTTWDWGSIFGWVWDRVSACLHGAIGGVVGTASGTLIVNLLARGGKVFVGPYGYAAIAVGGCVWSLVDE